MASVPQEVQREQATGAPIVLPITSRGLVLTDRLCGGILAAAMAVALALILYLNRGTTYYVDEVGFFLTSANLEPRDILEPDNGHLVATTRLVYAAVLEMFGADYLSFRLLGAATVLLSAALFYALIKPRIGALPALAPTLVLLFFGSDAQHIAIPLGFTAIFSVAAGLAALLALERGDLRGDIAACVLLVLSLATFSIGLAFLVGVAISVLVRPDRRRRAWIFLIPLTLYVIWFVWSWAEFNSAGEEGRLSNALLIPNYVFDSAASVLGALAGLNYDFGNSAPRVLEPGWGRILAAGAIVALALRLRRGNVPTSLWASLGIVLTYWALGALVLSELRPPGLIRYLYMGAVGVFLVATDAARPVRFSRLGLAALFAAAAVSLVANVALLRDGAAAFRDEYSPRIRGEFAMFELARGYVRPEFDRSVEVPEFLPDRPRAAAYLAVVDRYGGSPAFSLPDLERQSESVRQAADQSLASVLGIDLEPSQSANAAKPCRQLRSGAPGGAIEFELPPGGARLRAGGAAGATVMLGRFGTSPSVERGALPPGGRATLRIPPDSYPKPWRASVAGARSVDVCALS